MGRNYPCDNSIYVYFGQSGQDLNATGELNFKKQLYQCMIGQALEIKQTIETRMSQNTFGILVWQLNEIWPTGGWGSIEYGNPNFPGQVIGGRWKPLQYWYRNSFSDAKVSVLLERDLKLSAGAGVLEWFVSDKVAA